MLNSHNVLAESVESLHVIEIRGAFVHQQLAFLPSKDQGTASNWLTMLIGLTRTHLQHAANATKRKRHFGRDNVDILSRERALAFAKSTLL